MYTYNPAPVLIRALVFVDDVPPVDLMDGDLDSAWSWAIGNWRPEAVSSVTSIVVAEK